MPTLTCFACQAPVPAGGATCAGCGQPQTASAREQYVLRQDLEQQLRTTRTGALTVALVAFALGAATGAWATSSRLDTGLFGPSQTSASVVGQMSVEQIRDAFVRVVNADLSAQGLTMDLTGWTKAADGTPVFEIGPASAWRLLATDDRSKIMAWLGVQYTKALLVAGAPLDIPTQGHPVLHLAYHGQTTFLASRRGDGKIYLYDTSVVPASAPASAPAAAPAPAPAPALPPPTRP